MNRDLQVCDFVTIVGSDINQQFIIQEIIPKEKYIWIYIHPPNNSEDEIILYGSGKDWNIYDFRRRSLLENYEERAAYSSFLYGRTDKYQISFSENYNLLKNYNFII